MNDGRFKPGHNTWNKHLKGIHLSPRSEFKRGQIGNNWVPVGSTTVRMYHGKLRTYQKVAEPNTWRLRSQVVWELANGKLPKGFIVHHKDRNVLNDSLDNLELLSRGEHLMEHRAEYEAKRLEGMRNMKRSPMVCIDCGSAFQATKKAKYCARCKKVRIRASGAAYKAKMKTNHSA